MKRTKFLGMENVEIRPVSEHDAEEIARLDQQLTQRWRIEHWEERIVFGMRRDPEGSLVALAGGQLIGYLFTDVRGQEYGFPDRTGWLEAIGVDVEHQRSGLGRRLVEQVLERFRSQGVQQVRTLVGDAQSELEAFCRSVGFEVEPVKVLRLTTSVRS